LVKSLVDRREKILVQIEGLVRPHLVGVNTYDAMDAPEALAERAGISKDRIIKLNGNENPYGGSPRAVEAVSKVPLHIYPDPRQFRMREALSKYTGVDPESIVVGAGADELIDLIFRLFISPGDKILDFEPTFGMYSFCAEISGAEVQYIQRDALFEIDVPNVKSQISENTKLIFVTSPNNPTGNMASESQVIDLLDTGLVIIVDEAYFEFSGMSIQHLVTDYENLIVLRTMSKWAGLAGLRVGYGIMHPLVAKYLMTIKPPYNVNVAAEAALIASLEDSEYLLSNVQRIICERDRMFDLLRSVKGIKAWPSNGNYILCEFEENEVARVYQELASRGIFVRNFGSNRLRNCFRIAVGKPDETDVFVRALENILTRSNYA